MSFIEENSAIVDKQQLLDMYHQAVNDAPYSFFYVNMNAKDINKMFHIRFEQYMLNRKTRTRNPTMIKSCFH